MTRTSHKRWRSLQRFNYIFEIGLYIICSLCLVFFAVKGIYAKCFQAALIISVLLIMRGLTKWTRTRLSSGLRFSILLFITITMLLAKLFNMYSVIPHLDKIEHLLSGAILVYVGLLIHDKTIQRHPERHLHQPGAIWFALFFSVAMAGVWEIYEFTVDHLFGLVSQNGSLTDTMWDIICGTAGAIIIVVFLSFKVIKDPQYILRTDEA
ncbi:hypothetical protein [Paenibacillus dakarensis]|uniref:hypothetical protein n=1 Tax=Paenibacillus dakarensis TaxID=1527293 RepID=UPI0006D55004|nr:hypothetical protein [Paenibacillus dakarensis]